MNRTEKGRGNANVWLMWDRPATSWPTLDELRARYCEEWAKCEDLRDIPALPAFTCIAGVRIILLPGCLMSNMIKEICVFSVSPLPSNSFDGIAPFR